jgi:hypothetical protein
MNVSVVITVEIVTLLRETGPYVYVFTALGLMTVCISDFPVIFVGQFTTIL